MIRVIVFLVAVLAAALGLSWLSDNPGTVSIYWKTVNLQANLTITQVLIALVFLVVAALLAWSVLRNIWNGPAAVGSILNRRRQQKGLDALSSGMIAIGAGDRESATRYAIQARKSLPNEPMTHLLRAQAAQLAGDRATSRRIFEGMLGAPDTEQLGLRGLFVEAQRENEPEAAAQFASKALKLNSKLVWASDALFDIQCKTGQWQEALETLAVARRNGHIERAVADRRRAVLLTGLALKVEDGEPNQALTLATEAHGLAPDLIPAANLAGRMLASRGQTAKAAKILQRTWARSPHPDLATAYAFARIGDSPRDRIERVKQLAALNPHSPESAIAVANAAIDARAFDDARSALQPLIEENLTQRVATLMARVESEEHGDKGRVREWLARAVNAERDPVWTADGVVVETWQPISPVTGQLDAFQWRSPVETANATDRDLIARRSAELVALGSRNETPAQDEADGGPEGDDAPTPTPAARTDTPALNHADINPIGERGRATSEARPVSELEPRRSFEPVETRNPPGPSASVQGAERSATVGRPSPDVGGAGRSVQAASIPISPPPRPSGEPALRRQPMSAAGVAGRPNPAVASRAGSPPAPDDPGPEPVDNVAGANGSRRPYTPTP